MQAATRRAPKTIILTALAVRILDYARRCALDPPSAPLGPFYAYLTRTRRRQGDFGASYVHLGSITLPPVELRSDLAFCGSI